MSEPGMNSLVADLVRVVESAGQLQLIAPEMVARVQSELVDGSLSPGVSALATALGVRQQIVQALLTVVSDSPEEGEEDYAQLASLFRAVRSGESGGGFGTVGVEETIDIADREDRSGETVLNSDRYRILERIGRGGMGDVFRVHDDQVDREVAVKLLRNDRGRDERARGKFRREAKITGQLEHPNIVPLHDFSVDSDGGSFFSMKLVRGESLAERLRELRRLCGVNPGGQLTFRSRGRRSASFDASYPLTRRLQDFLKVCDAVAFAHSRKVLHRDLKPSNIMLGEFGEVLVMDWGLARTRLEDSEGSQWSNSAKDFWRKAQLQIEQGDSELAISTLAEGLEVVSDEEEPSLDTDGFTRFSHELTREGDVLGTLAYMAPEQAAGRTQALDERTDIYCLGATLYEILALIPPFGMLISSSTQEELNRICRGEFLPPSERAIPGTVPPELEQVVLKAMALKPQDRYQTVGALQQDIMAFLDGRLLDAVRYGPLERLGKWTRRHRVLVRSVGTILMLSIGVFLVLGWKQRGETRDRFQEEVSRAESWLEEIQQTAQRERRFELYLEAVAALDRALGMMPRDSVARALRRRAGEGLGRAALEGRDYMLARRTFEDLERFGLPVEKVTRLVVQVKEARDRVQTERRDRLLAMVKDIGGGLHRPNREAGLPGLEDYIYEASGFRDEQTVKLLSAQLDGLVQKKNAGGGEWLLRERNLATFACRVLGRTGLPSAVAPLSRWIAVLEDVDLILEAAQALGNTRHESAHQAIILAGTRFGGDPEVQRKIQQILARVPIPVMGRLQFPADFFHRAVRRQRAGDLRGAMEDYSHAISMMPGLKNAYVNRAVIRQKLKDDHGALADLETALGMDPDLGRAHRVRGVLLLKMKRFPEAEASLTRAIELEDDLAFTLFARGELRHQTGNQVGALEDATRAQKLAPEDWRIPFLMGSVFRMRGHKERALKAYSRVLHLDPENREALVYRALLYSKSGEATRALTDIGSALSKAPGDIELLLVRAGIHVEREDLEAARDDFEQCLAIDPKRIPILLSLDRLYRKLGHPDKALQMLDKVIVLAPNRVEFRVNRGALLDSLGHLDRAFEDFDTAIRVSPGMSVAFVNRGIVHQKLGRLQQARSDFERALDLGSVPTGVYLLLGDLLRQMGEHKGAVRRYKAYLDLEPHAPRRAGIEAYLRSRQER